MANERRLNALIQGDRTLPTRADLFAHTYFGVGGVVRWFYFDFGVDIPILTSSATEIDIRVTNFGDTALVNIELIEQSPSDIIDFGRLTYSFLQQIKNKVYDGQFIAGIALTVGKRNTSSGPIPAPVPVEDLVLLELYIKRGGRRIIISRDGSGGDNLTPTSIPPRK